MIGFGSSDAFRPSQTVPSRLTPPRLAWTVRRRPDSSRQIGSPCFAVSLADNLGLSLPASHTQPARPPPPTTDPRSPSCPAGPDHLSPGSLIRLSAAQPIPLGPNHLPTLPSNFLLAQSACRPIANLNRRLQWAQYLSQTSQLPAVAFCSPPTNKLQTPLLCKLGSTNPFLPSKGHLRKQKEASLNANKGHS